MLWIRFESHTSKVMRSNPVHRLPFIFQLENMFRSYLNFSTSLLTNYKGYVQPMSKRWRHTLCPNWLDCLWFKSFEKIHFQ